MAKLFKDVRLYCNVNKLLVEVAMIGAAVAYVKLCSEKAFMQEDKCTLDILQENVDTSRIFSRLRSALFWL